MDTGIVLSPEQDILSPEALGVIRKHITQEEGNVNFNIMALVHHGG
jgi:hypothetical protein